MPTSQKQMRLAKYDLITPTHKLKSILQSFVDVLQKHQHEQFHFYIIWAGGTKRTSTQNSNIIQKLCYNIWYHVLLPLKYLGHCSFYYYQYIMVSFMEDPMKKLPQRRRQAPSQTEATSSCCEPWRQKRKQRQQLAHYVSLSNKNTQKSQLK